MINKIKCLTHERALFFITLHMHILDFTVMPFIFDLVVSYYNQIWPSKEHQYTFSQLEVFQQKCHKFLY